MKRAKKILLVFVCFFCLSVTVSNIASVSLKAGENGDGTCVYLNGTFRCMDDGNECTSDSDCKNPGPTE